MCVCVCVCACACACACVCVSSLLRSGSNQSKLKLGARKGPAERPQTKLKCPPLLHRPHVLNTKCLCVCVLIHSSSSSPCNFSFPLLLHYLLLLPSASSFVRHLALSLLLIFHSLIPSFSSPTPSSLGRVTYHLFHLSSVYIHFILSLVTYLLLWVSSIWVLFLNEFNPCFSDMQFYQDIANMLLCHNIMFLLL